MNSYIAPSEERSQLTFGPMWTGTVDTVLRQAASSAPIFEGL